MLCSSCTSTPHTLALVLRASKLLVGGIGWLVGTRGGGDAKAIDHAIAPAEPKHMVAGYGGVCCDGSEHVLREDCLNRPAHVCAHLGDPQRGCRRTSSVEHLIVALQEGGQDTKAPGAAATAGGGGGANEYGVSVGRQPHNVKASELR